jgi:dipeptidyl aminopeptidase/acylaminoacyl peptidase
LDISADLNNYALQKVSPYGKGNKYTYNLRTKSLRCTALNEVASVARELDVYVRPISYLSRDKLKIEGYLTLPLGKVPENLPTVVFVHGGPWGRDFWSANGEVDFLRSRGYAVLQINFRGSTGYGREFLEKGDRQWGERIQNDITDGVKWLIKRGIADKDKIAIYGTSFGGYAALCGLTFTPKLYACGVSCCGFSDVVKHLQNASIFWPAMKKQNFYHVGDPVADAEKLKKASPAYHLDKVEKPLFVAHGANDSRVTRAESDRVVNALNENGAKVEYMVREGEGHGFRKAQNRRDFYNWLEEFLTKHLKPSKEAKIS